MCWRATLVLTTLAVGYTQVMRSYQRERRVSYFQRIALVEQAWSDNNVSRAEEMLDSCPANFRGWEWWYLKQLCHADQLTLQVHQGRLQPNALAYSPDGEMLAVTSESGAIELRRAGTGQLLRSFGANKGGVYALAFRPDGAGWRRPPAMGRFKSGMSPPDGSSSHPLLDMAGRP